MKKRHSLLALLLLLALMLPACGSAIPEAETAPAGTEKTAGTVPPAPVTTEEEKPLDPAEDGILNVLMVGNSFCYHYVDELYGMLKEVGIESEIWNLYYSGATVKQHWGWYLENSAVCTLYRASKNGRQEYKDSTLKGALARRNWDVISLQTLNNIKQTFGGMNTDGATAEDIAKNGMENAVYAEKLANLIRKSYPLAKLYWHHTWAFQVGFERSGVTVPDKATQQMMYEGIHLSSREIADKLGLVLVPSGDAWQIAREDPAVGDVLCNRLKDGGDNYHDGDIGGGQYLIACVWFEILTGQSCLGNAFRPSYTLSEEMVAGLQRSAHEAVAGSSANET